MKRAGHPTRAIHRIAGLPVVRCSGVPALSTVDLKQALQVTDLTGGWLDGGIVDGKNKLVPTVSFRVRKNIDQAIRPISLNVHRVSVRRFRVVRKSSRKCSCSAWNSAKATRLI